MSHALSAATVLRVIFRRFRMISSISLIVCVASTGIGEVTTRSRFPSQSSGRGIG